MNEHDCTFSDDRGEHDGFFWEACKSIRLSEDARQRIKSSIEAEAKRGALREVQSRRWTISLNPLRYFAVGAVACLVVVIGLVMHGPSPLSELLADRAGEPEYKAASAQRYHSQAEARVESIINSLPWSHPEDWSVLSRRGVRYQLQVDENGEAIRVIPDTVVPAEYLIGQLQLGGVPPVRTKEGIWLIESETARATHALGRYAFDTEVYRCEGCAFDLAVRLGDRYYAILMM